MKPATIVILILILFALMVFSGAFYTVDQTQHAIVLQLGKPVPEKSSINDPGLKFKIPFVQKVLFFAR